MQCLRQYNEPEITVQWSNVTNAIATILVPSQCEIRQKEKVAVIQ